MKFQRHNENIVDPARRKAILIGFGALTAGIIARLGYLQILNGKNFEIASLRNRMREILLPAPRGIIYDKNGEMLISNKIFYDLVIIPQYLQNQDKTLSIVADLFNIPHDYIQGKLDDSRDNPKFLPIKIKRNLSLHEIVLLESNKFFLPGINIDAEARRDYTGSESAHLFGYIAEITPKELEIFNVQNRAHLYQPGFTIGKSGIEKKCEIHLRGTEGKETRLVDAFGRLQTSDLNINIHQKPVRGNDVYLTIDRTLQEEAEKAFWNKNGAVCAMNPKTGAILAYLSNPNYKLSLYQDGLTSSDWQALRTNPLHPLLDKVTGGAYPPGSTFKAVTAFAALENNVVTPDRRFVCPGYFNIGSYQWKCWKHEGHGSVNLTEAIMLSCDVYFYNVSHLLGIDPITKWARLFGLGERSGLDLNMELKGVVPSQEWKLRTKKVPWQKGDTINAAFGQGYNNCTPLQILNLYSTIANGGNLYKPYLINKVLAIDDRIIFESQPTLIRNLNLNETHLSLVKKGLFDVVQAPRGTAKRARVTGFNVSGKTGTAQNASLKVTKDIDKANVDLLALDHAWFVGYAPSEDPEISVVVFSEYEGGGGGAFAAPIAQRLFEAYFRKKFPEKFPEQTIQGV